MVTTATGTYYTPPPFTGYLSVERIWKYATTYNGDHMHSVEEDVNTGHRAGRAMCGLPANRVPLLMECAMPRSIPKCQNCQRAIKASMRERSK